LCIRLVTITCDGLYGYEHGHDEGEMHDVWGESVIIGRDQSGKVTYVRGRLIRDLAQELIDVNLTLILENTI